MMFSLESALLNATAELYMTDDDYITKQDDLDFLFTIIFTLIIWYYKRTDMCRAR